MGSLTFADQAERIEVAHQRAGQAVQTALDAAKEAGDLLAEVKATLPHGAWTGWLAENVSFSVRTAQTYMRVASNWDGLKAQRAAGLSLRGAVDVLADPKPVAPEVVEMGSMDPKPSSVRQTVSISKAHQAAEFFGVSLHHVCTIWPMGMTAGELLRLAESIRHSGLEKPIITNEAGEVIDGKLRLIACVIAGVEPRFETTSDDPRRVCIARNHLRRHMHPDEIAALAMSQVTSSLDLVETVA